MHVVWGQSDGMKHHPQEPLFHDIIQPWVIWRWSFTWNLFIYFSNQCTFSHFIFLLTPLPPKKVLVFGCWFLVIYLVLICVWSRKLSEMRKQLVVDSCLEISEYGIIWNDMLLPFFFSFFIFILEVRCCALVIKCCIHLEREFLLYCSIVGLMKLWFYLLQGLLTLCGMHDLESKPILLCSCNDNTVHLYDLPSWVFSWFWLVSSILFNIFVSIYLCFQEPNKPLYMFSVGLSCFRFSERGKIYAKQEVRAIQMGPGGLFFTGDGAGQVKVWRWLAESTATTRWVASIMLPSAFFSWLYWLVEFTFLFWVPL